MNVFQSKKVLLCLTTANQWHYTEQAVEVFKISYPTGVDLLVVDDASEDETVTKLRNLGIEVLTKLEPKGVTDSWNIAYREFLGRGYDILFLANNDILIPRGSLEPLAELLNNEVLVSPMSTPRGVGHIFSQSYYEHYPKDLDCNDSLQYQAIQDNLSHSTKTHLSLPVINGFFLGMDRKIVTYQLGPDTLFDPTVKNIKNEDELCRRIPKGKVCSLRSFIYHHKGVSFSEYRIGRFTVINRQLTWKEARAAKEVVGFGETIVRIVVGELARIRIQIRAYFSRIKRKLFGSA